MDFVNGWSGKTGIPLTRRGGYGACLEQVLLVAAALREGQRAQRMDSARLLAGAAGARGVRRGGLAYYDAHPQEGYRRLTFMMQDENIVAVSPTTVWRVLNHAGRLHRWGTKTSKGLGFQQPLKPHEHWHIDVSYVNIRGTFYYLCSILDGCSRYIVHWDLRESMTEADIEIVLQKARDSPRRATPKRGRRGGRLISDNGPRFIAKDFKEFIRISGMRHVKISPYYPQSNGKIERWHQSLKRECIRPGTPPPRRRRSTMRGGLPRRIAGYVEHYNCRRLHSAIGYVTPKDKLEGREQTILDERDRKLEAARAHRAAKRKEHHGILALAG